ncbi:hypothetical protein KTT_12180 [Tengunoibacter tsumagoiensis]|uniref:Uncharacterized protein n=1 Tax=Tengunoibacter tsumagoiensis TaxID=2014871 RepID=A0A401ZWR7_9CHLR|nr:hypothetical protein KTT_12180 [Tengunoibacter tsumagoiensis]
MDAGGPAATAGWNATSQELRRKEIQSDHTEEGASQTETAWPSFFYFWGKDLMALTNRFQASGRT